MRNSLVSTLVLATGLACNTQPSSRPPAEVVGYQQSTTAAEVQGMLSDSKERGELSPEVLDFLKEVNIQQVIQRLKSRVEKLPPKDPIPPVLIDTINGQKVVISFAYVLGGDKKEITGKYIRICIGDTTNIFVNDPQQLPPDLIFLKAFWEK